MLNYDCLCVADMCVDLLLWGNVRPQFRQVEQIVDGYLLELGGSANLFASQFTRLGGRAGVLGRVGRDALGDFVLQRLHDAGVDVSHVHRHGALPTGLGLALVDGHDRAILTVPGTIDAVTPADLTDDLLSATRHWHIASFYLLAQLRPAWRAWLVRCRQAGVTTSLDTNWDPEGKWLGVLDVLPWVDVFLPNEAEALAITGAPDVEQAGAMLAERCANVIIKRGAQGAMAFSMGRVWHRRRARDAPPLRIADTIGAGDCFDAGFLRAWQLGQSMEDCLAWAARCAYASLAEPGGFAGQLRETITEEG